MRPAGAPASRRLTIAARLHSRSCGERRAAGWRVHPHFSASTLTVLAPTPVFAAICAWVSAVPS
jgi:hypothetical protein